MPLWHVAHAGLDSSRIITPLVRIIGCLWSSIAKHTPPIVIEERVIETSRKRIRTSGVSCMRLVLDHRWWQYRFAAGQGWTPQQSLYRRLLCPLLDSDASNEFSFRVPYFSFDGSSFRTTITRQSRGYFYRKCFSHIKDGRLLARSV